MAAVLGGTFIQMVAFSGSAGSQGGNVKTLSVGPVTRTDFHAGTLPLGKPKLCGRNAVGKEGLGQKKPQAHADQRCGPHEIEIDPAAP
jgi:hypothetical protein